MRPQTQSIRAAALILLAAGALFGGSTPPLTPEITDSATRYMEWLLDVRFSPEDRGRYAQVLETTWNGRNQGARAGVATMAENWQKLSARSEAERNSIREKVQDDFVKALRSASDNDARWLVALYDQAHAATPVPAPASPTSPAPAGAPIGNWSSSHVSSIQYKNAYTGVSAPTNGNRFAYEFRPDGTYSFTGLMQSVMYNCTTAVFSNEQGTYRVEGSTVSLNPIRNPYKMTYSCSPSSNKESPGKLIARSYRFRVYREGEWTKIDLTDEKGSVQTFHRDR